MVNRNSWNRTRKHQESERDNFATTTDYFQVYLWVLNDEEEFEMAVQLGVTGIMTDYPSKLKKFLLAHPGALVDIATKT